jgi:N-terminal domain of anti-restriction factor ArdC
MPHAAPAHKSFSDREPLSADHRQDHCRARTGARALGAALGRRHGTTRPAEERRHRPKLSGINILILWCAVAERGFTGQNWLTFRQALKLSGHARKGETGTTVVYADRFIPYRERQRAAETGHQPDAIPFLKSFTVFNADQCEGLSADIAPPPPSNADQCEGLSADIAPPPPSLADHDDLVLPQAEALIRTTGADIRMRAGCGRRQGLAARSDPEKAICAGGRHQGNGAGAAVRLRTPRRLGWLQQRLI